MNEDNVKIIEEDGIETVIVEDNSTLPEEMPTLETNKEENISEETVSDESDKKGKKKKKETHKFVVSKEESKKKNKAKRRELFVSIGCKIIAVFIVIWSLAVFSLGIVFGWHTTVQMHERSFLTSQGYVGKFSAGDYNLNIYRTGNSMSKHTIVGLSGLGIQDYSVAMSLVHDELKSDLRFVYVDRAGYALSEDTRETQTIERIVSDYRNALLSANIKPPYILMPHSIGGVYATYWASMYPEEIEGIIYIDGTALTMDAIGEVEQSTRLDELFVELAQIGYSRIVQDEHIELLPDSYSKTLIEISETLQAQSVATFARLSEFDESINNKLIALENIKQTDIPKVYVCAYAGFQTKEEVKEYFEWPYNKAVSVEYTDERAEKLLQQVKDIRDTQVIPYVESLGNTELVYLPGDHLIYLQKPTELANIIRNFIYKLSPELMPEGGTTENTNNAAEVETVVFMNCAVNKESLSNDTLGWLEWYNNLPEEEQMAIDYVPSDLLEICGMTLEEIIGVPEETEEYTEEFEAYTEEDSDDEYSEDINWDEPSYG